MQGFVPTEDETAAFAWSQSSGAAALGTPKEYVQMPEDGAAHVTASSASSRLKYVDSPGPGPDTRVHVLPASSVTRRAAVPAHEVGMSPVRDEGGA